MCMLIRGVRLREEVSGHDLAVVRVDLCQKEGEMTGRKILI
jgi:hypothetical protein